MGLMSSNGSLFKGTVTKFVEYGVKTAAMDYDGTIPKESKAKVIFITACGTGLSGYNNPIISSGILSERGTINYPSDASPNVPPATVGYFWFVTDFQLPLNIKITTNGWDWGYAIEIYYVS